MAFIGFLFGFLVVAFFNYYFTYTDKDKFHKKLAIFINSLKLNPIQDTSCLWEALSPLLLAAVY